MRCMNRIAASTTPTSIADRQVDEHGQHERRAAARARSPAGARIRCRNCVRPRSCSTRRSSSTAARLGERHVARQRRQHQHEQQQEHRVQDAGDAASGAGADVGGGARDRAGRGQAAEQRARRCWRRPAPPARSSSVCARPVMPSATTADSRRLDAGEEGDREGARARSVADLRPVERAAAAASGSALGISPNAAADGGDRQVERGTPRARRRTTAIRKPGHFGARDRAGRR